MAARVIVRQNLQLREGVTVSAYWPALAALVEVSTKTWRRLGTLSRLQLRACLLSLCCVHFWRVSLVWRVCVSLLFGTFVLFGVVILLAVGSVLVVTLREHGSNDAKRCQLEGPGAKCHGRQPP